MRLLATIIVVVLMLTALFACKPKEDAVEPEEHNVSLDGIREAVVCDGVIEPKTTVEIKSKASGALEYKAFEVGDVVEAGDLMYRLDKSLIEQSVVQARADLKSAQAQLALAKRDQTREERVQLENSVAQAKLELSDAENYYNRIKDLHEREYVTDQELADANVRLNKAKLNLELSEKRLSESNRGGEKENIQIAESRVILAEASLKNALEELKETEIIAPITGVIVVQDVEVGDTITSATRGSAAGSILCTVADLSQVFLQGYVDETDIGRVKVGMSAEVNINSYPGRVFEGRLAKIYPKAEAQQGVTAFKVDIELIGTGFVTRQTMNINLHVSKSDNVQNDNENNESVEGNAKTDSKQPSEDSTKDPKSVNETKPSSESGGKQKGGKHGKGQYGKGSGGLNLSDSPVEVRAGMSADAEIIIRDVPEALIIPVTFVNFREQPPTVNLKDAATGEYAPIEVSVGFTDGVNIVVEEGLKEGDIIVRVPRKEKEPLRK